MDQFGRIRGFGGTSAAAPVAAGVGYLASYPGQRCDLASVSASTCLQRLQDDAESYSRARAANYTDDRSFGFLGDPLNPVTGKHYGFLITADPY